MKRQTKKNAPQKSELHDYLSTSLFRWVRASDEKTYSKSMPLKEALNCKYIDPNNNGYIRILTIDVDWEIPLDDYIDRMPVPNVIVSNSENGHVQIMYFLQSRVYRENAKIMYAYQMIKDSLNRALKGDFSFAGRLQKNPLHPCWNATWFNNEPYILTDLIDWSMKQELEMDEGSRHVYDSSSRNETIFRGLLKYACRHNKGLTCETLETYAEYLNSLVPEFGTTIKTPLDPPELRCIVRSVWKFMKSRYTGRFKRGEGQYTDEQRERSIETRVARKWKNIHLFAEYRRMKLGSKRIAEILGVTIKTIKNYTSALRRGSSSADSTLSHDSTPGLAPTSNSSGATSAIGCADCAKQHDPARPPTPPTLRWITDTVFHRIGGLLATDELAAKRLIQDTS